MANEEMSAPNLLRAAARLVGKALHKLDMTEVACPHCETRLFKNREHARIYEQLDDTAAKLERAADRLVEAERNVTASKGFAAAAVAAAKATR